MNPWLWFIGVEGPPVIKGKWVWQEPTDFKKIQSTESIDSKWRAVVKKRGPHPKQDFIMRERGMTEADAVKKILSMGYMPQDIQLLEPSLE